MCTINITYARNVLYNNDKSAIYQFKLSTISHRWFLTKSLYDASELFEASPIQLFISMYHPSQCLYHLLPPERNLCFNVRATGHSRQLIVQKFKRTRDSYLVRILFDNI